MKTELKIIAALGLWSGWMTIPIQAQVFTEIGGSLGVKKSLESDDPRPKAGAFRPIHGFATAIF